jgi:hypothetical protein
MRQRKSGDVLVEEEGERWSEDGSSKKRHSAAPRKGDSNRLSVAQANN